MTGHDKSSGPGHAFISYVHEDKERVDRLQRDLEDAGVNVWRDTENLWPGQDWQREIRAAITASSLVFIACFSEHSDARKASYHNEELILAAEQMRLRTSGTVWLIPVRFAPCTLPDLDLGAGRSLRSLQWVDLFGETHKRDISRLLASVQGILGNAPTGSKEVSDAIPGVRARSVPSESALQPRAQVVSTLPADTASFTGRVEQLDRIKDAAITAAAVGRVVAIHAINGMPGVGKTALAVHVGHLVADQFPDRQLFVDLHAHTPGQLPADPADVLAGLLAADGVDARSLPSDLDGRAAMWRDRMAGQRVLLILDNAASSDQVAPLLPGAAGSLVLVTSRRYLGDLLSALVPIPLSTLPADDAVKMFVRLCRRAGQEPVKVAKIVALCGYLPLAISLLASVHNRHQIWTMEHLISETRTKLLAVRAENRTVAAAFELSYQYLSERRQQFFRRLGLHPGTTIDCWAVAALTGVALREAVEELDALYGEGFLIETGHRRYGMHDLIREYARDLAAADSRSDGRAALDRLAHACYGFVNFAFNQLNNGNPMVDIGFLDTWLASGMPGVGAVDEIFDEAGSATAWFGDQIANLTAVTRAANEHGLAITARLACSMFYLLEVGGYFEEWRDIEEIGKEAATNPLDRARSLRNRGRLELVRVLEAQERLYDHGDPRPSPASACSAAIPLLEESRDLYRACADQNGEGTALREFADALRLEADPEDPESIDRAIAGYREAERVYRAMGNQNAVASLTQAMGITYARGRRYAQAESCFLDSLAYASVEVRGKARHGRLKAYSLRRLADLYRDLGNLDQAVEHYERWVWLLYRHPI